MSRCTRSEERGARSEERVTVWRADHIDDAIGLVEVEALEYAAAIDSEYLGLAQCYTMADDMVAGAEVFSLVRVSQLSASDYLDTFFDTGRERQTRHEGG
jgi:hypothetical protein